MTTEIQREILTQTLEHFSPSDRQTLRLKGALIYPSTGISIGNLKGLGLPYWTGWRRGSDCNNIVSRLSEVAFFPDGLYLPNSDRKTFGEQLEMFRKFAQQIRREVPGVKAITGTAADYAELVFVHLNVSGKRLFGEDYQYGYTRTTTPIGDSCLALVGGFSNTGGLNITGFDPNDRCINVGLVPLIVPDTHG